MNTQVLLHDYHVWLLVINLLRAHWLENKD
jgi:hypothetical protein